MFTGEFLHTLDSKNRIIIPTRLRDELGKSFVLSKGLDGCISVYPEQEWVKYIEQSEKVSQNYSNSRRLTRFLLSGATMTETDRQGRVLIPPSLLKHAQLEGEVVILGVNRRIEIWSKQRWDEYNGNNQDMEAIAEEMAQLGF